MNEQNTILIVYRLYNPSYGEKGNPCTLTVLIRPDNTFKYSLYSGWQNSGMGEAMSNLGMKSSLPMGRFDNAGTLPVARYSTVNKLDKEIQECLATGYGSRHIKEVQILNKFPA